MITKEGQVIITESGITVTGFTFEGVTFPAGGIEAVQWAKQKLENVNGE